ncbi:hypothetical protein NSTC731_01153 [Nostoc sp. DSM 114167]
MYEQGSDRLDRCSHLEKVVFSPSSDFPMWISITGLRNVSRCPLVCDGASAHDIGDRISWVYSSERLGVGTEVFGVALEAESCLLDSAGGESVACAELETSS